MKNHIHRVVAASPPVASVVSIRGGGSWADHPPATRDYCDRSAASRPALRPNTAAFINAVPPG